MRKSIVGFSAGFICGALFLDLLSVNAMTVLKEGIRYNLYGEQELRARRAEREDNYMRALVHRWTTVDALSEDGFRVFRPEFARSFGGGFLFPFQALAVRLPGKAFPEVKLRRFNEGVCRAQLAFAMEKVGMGEAAEEQWNKAAELSMDDIDVLKEMVVRLRGIADSEQSMEAERAMLGD